MRKLASTVLALAGASALILAACNTAAAPGGAANAASSSGKPVLVAIGASDAVGIGATNPDRDNWVAKLGARLPSGSRVVNLGISGATAAQALEQELPVALDASPTLAVVWLGVNDLQARVSLADFTRDLARLLDGLRTQTGARIFVGNLPDLRLLPAFQSRDAAALSAEVLAWNAAIAGVTRDAGGVLVDVYRSWSDGQDRAALISSDGLHPTTAGYARLAELFWQSIHGGA